MASGHGHGWPSSREDVEAGDAIMCFLSLSPEPASCSATSSSSFHRHCFSSVSLRVASHFGHSTSVVLCCSTMLSVARSHLLLSILCRAALVSAVPTLSFPINSQVPPVARIDELFSFVFSSTTFTSASAADITYSLVDPPSWLSLDSDSRRIYGTPQDGDIASGKVVGVNVTLVATDSTGSTSDDATLVVSRSPGPTVQIPVSEQIQDFGNYSEPSSILYYPDASFKFAFASDTFSDPDAPILNFYPVMTDNSPLPAWITFDPSTLAFAGTTPPFSSLIEPPQTFSLKLIASDVTGFSAASVNFSIVVGMHTLTTDQPDIILNATAGKELGYDRLAGSIQIDGQDADLTDVNITAESLPSWLSFDQSSWNISGTPPDDAQATNFTVIVQDRYGDVLNITFDVQLTGNNSFFQGVFPSLSVKPGGQLSFKLGSYLVDPAAVDVTVDIQPATSWMAWDASTLTLLGNVPISAPKSVVDVTFTVESRSSTKAKRAATNQSQKLVIQIDSAVDTTSPATSASTSSAATSTHTASSSDATAQGAPKWTIIAIVVSSVAALALVACLCFCCCTRRRKKKRHSESTINSTRASAALPGGLIETPGRAVGSPDPHSTTSPNDKEKGKLRKASNLRTELTPPPLRPVRSLADLYNDDDHSVMSTPGSKLKDWFSSLRSFRVVQMRRARARATPSVFSDYGSSHHDLDLDTDLAFAPSRPPVLQLPLQSEGTGPQRTSLEADGQRIPNGGSIASDRRQSKGKNAQGLPTPAASSIRLVERDPFTDTPPKAAPETISPITEREAFTSHPISPISPIFPLEGTSSAFAMTPSSAITPSSTAGPSSLIPSSSLLPTSTHRAPRRAATTPSRHPGLRSQRSNASASSTDTMRARTRHKLSAKAKGALFALQSPKRRTLAALGKKPSFQFVPRKKRSHRGVLESVDCDSESVLGTNPSERSRSGSRGGGGIAGFLSPRIWPQPAGGPGQPASVPTPRVGGPVGLESEAHLKRRRNISGSAHESGSLSGSSHGSAASRGYPPPLRVPQPPIRRRPVPAPAGAAARGSDGSDGLGGPGLRRSGSSSGMSSVKMPSPLRTPGMSGTPVGGGSGAGLGISTYEDIVRSSPLHPSREASAGAGAERDGDLDTDRGDSWTSAGVGTILDRERERRGSLGWTSAVSESLPSSTQQHSAKSSAATAAAAGAGAAGVGGSSGDRARAASDGAAFGERRHSVKTEGRRSGVSGKSGRSKTSSDIGAFV